MGEGEPKGGPKPTIARFALAANLKTLMDGYPLGFKRGIKSRELAGQAGVSYKTIDRMLNPYEDTGPSLESIDSVAAFFRVQTWELLVPRSKLPALVGTERQATGSHIEIPTNAKAKRRASR
jgi:transcriptional regulator with XRE-family HTH domain